MQTLSETINKVKEFHATFGLQYFEKPQAAIDKNIIALRHKLMQEENDEYLEAAMNNDLEQIADALGDKLYILCGTIIAHGLQHASAICSRSLFMAASRYSSFSSCISL